MPGHVRLFLSRSNLAPNKLSSRESKSSFREPSLTTLTPQPPSVGPLLGHTEIDHTLTPDARAAIEAGVPASTRRAYTRDWDQFARWCAAAGHVPLQATPETVAGYVTHLTTTPRKRPLAPSSIERALAAIRTTHRPRTSSRLRRRPRARCCPATASLLGRARPVAAPVRR
ncbi:site-specific integrase [Nonomuraea roseoviolacea]|uniref:site-specific integrase n=1 Tax=Nonomuraea roseoviolacea TaxID=103837 RepID=UPI003CD0912C